MDASYRKFIWLLEILKIDSLTARKMRSMSQKAMNAKASDSISQSIKLIKEQLLTESSERLFS